MAAPISIADCSEARVPELQRFYGEVYRPSYVLATDERLLRWQFGGGLERGLHVILARRADRIVGALGYIPVEVSAGGNVRAGAWTANWITHPDERTPVGPFLMRELVRRHDITLVVGVSPAASSLLPRLGWTDFGDLPRYLCVIDAATARSLDVDDLEEVRLDRIGPPGDLTVERVVRFTDAATALWDSTRGSTGFGTRRSAAFLNWRYAAHPVFEYRLCEARRGTALRGLAVWRLEPVEDRGLTVGRVVELVGHPDAVRPLVAGVMREASASGVALLDFFGSDSAVARDLAACGWRCANQGGLARVPRLFNPVARSSRGVRFMAHLGPALARHTASAWYVTRGDGDQDRPN